MDLLSATNILIVDDEKDTLLSLKRFLRQEPYTCHFAQNAQDALKLCQELELSVVVTDLMMPGTSGLELIETLQSDYPSMVRVVLSGTDDIGMIINTINSSSIFRFAPKPVEPESLKKIINDAISFYRLQLEHRELTTINEKQNRFLTGMNDELRLMATRLRESELRFRAMNDAAFDPIFLIDRTGAIVYANKAAETLFGYTGREFLSMFLKDFMSPREIEAGTDTAMFSSDHGKPREFSVEFLGKDGRLINTGTSVGTVDIKSVPHQVVIARDNTLRIMEENNRRQLEKVQRALESQIERRLLQSRNPDNLCGAAISSFMISSGHLNGDYSDFIVYDRRHVDLILGDVMGHGILSALVGLGMKSLYLKTIARRNQEAKIPALEEVACELHEQSIHELLEIGIFTTLLFFRLDLEAGMFSMIDCGHTASIHLHAAQGTHTLLKGTNLPMGLVEQQEFEAVTAPVENGDIIVLYSDGITESLLPDGTMFGENRLADIVLENRQLDVDAILGAIRGGLAAATGRESYDDDASCIVIRIEECHG